MHLREDNGHDSSSCTSKEHIQGEQDLDACDLEAIDSLAWRKIFLSLFMVNTKKTCNFFEQGLFKGRYF